MRFRFAVLLLATACAAERPVAEPVAFEALAAQPSSTDPGFARDPGNGDALMAWAGTAGDGWGLYFSRSADQGTTWTTPVLVAAGQGEVSPHAESSVRLVAGPGGRVGMIWPNSIRVEGRKWPAAMIRFSRSADGGATWSPARTLNDDTTGVPVSHQFHGAAWSGDSGLVVTWLDERGGSALEVHHGDHSTEADPTSEPDAAIYAATSTDFGASWSARNTPLWGQVCPCCRVTLARGPGGRVMSAWRRHFPGNIRDVVVAGAAPGSAPVRVNVDGWVYPGCPHTGPAMAVDSGGTIHVAWFTGKPGAAGVFYQRIGPDGTAILQRPVGLVTGETVPTAHTAVAPMGAETLVAWDVLESGDPGIALALVGTDGVVGRPLDLKAPGGHHPHLLALQDGVALLAWTEPVGDGSRVRVVRVRADGSE
ncbi:MAG: sialidase family protein [Gemmatimonadales bacterium]